jgi:membrane protease YdiL (CAAX protease family)
VVTSGQEGQATACHYCGAPLSPFFYFCLACGTPYKPINSVVAPLRPRQLTDGELVDRKVPHLRALFWSYFGTLIGALLVTELTFREDRPDLQILVGDVMLLVLTCVWGWIYRKSLVAQFSVFGFGNSAAWAGLAVLVPLLAINYGYHTFLQNLSSKDQGDPFEDLRNINPAVLIVSFCVLPAVVEEIAFRGLVQHWLHAAIRPRNAIIFASFLFTVLHFSILSFPYLFAVGLLLGWVKWKTGSLYPSILIHFLHNFVVIEYFEK